MVSGEFEYKIRKRQQGREEVTLPTLLYLYVNGTWRLVEYDLEGVCSWIRSQKDIGIVLHGLKDAGHGSASVQEVESDQFTEAELNFFWYVPILN